MQSRWGSLFLALALVVPFAGIAVADDDDDEGGDDRSGSNRGSDPRSSSENRSAIAREHAEERRVFVEEQREERRAFEQELRERLAACRDENLTEEAREDCEEEIEDDRDAFNERQREERRAFEEGLREEFHEDFERVHSAPAERIGHFRLATAAVNGKFVGFTLDSENATITNLTISGQLVLDRIQITGAGALEEVKQEGAVLKLEYEKAELRLHDNPALALKAEVNDGATGLVDIADYLNVTGENETRTVTDGANLTATLRIEGNVEPAGGNAFGFDKEARLVVHGENPILPDVANRHRAEIEEAKRHGRVGGEFTVARADGVVLDVQLLEDVLVNFTRGPDVLRFEVGAENLGGKTFVVNVDRELLRADDLRIRYFDETNETFVETPISRAEGGLPDCLDATDDEGPEYCIVRGDDGWQVIVSVPSFSVHAFTISGEGTFDFIAEAPPSAIAGVLAAFVFATVAGVTLFRRRKA